MNDSKPLNPFQRWRRRLGARFATPQPLFLTAEGVLADKGGPVQPFADWCAGHAGQAAELIVSARLLHEMVCEPGLPLEGEAALQAYARQLFSHYFGAAALRWPLASWQAGAGADARRGASALHGLDWAALQQGAGEADVELRRVRPAWAPLLGEAPGDGNAGLAWVEGPVLSWLLVRGGELQSLRQLRLAEATQAALAETLAELRAVDEVDAVVAAGYGLEGGSLTPVWPGVRVLGRLDAAGPDMRVFDAPPAGAGRRLPAPDFLGQRVQRSMLAWPLALTGALVLATAAWSAWSSHRQLDEAQAGLAELQARRAVASGARQPARPVAAVARPADAERLRSAAEVQALLQQPWEPLLARVEQAGAGQLNWLALDYSAGRNELRLEGLVQDKLVALQLVDRLAAAPGWRDVVLSRFQTGEQGLSGQRFELNAKLQGERP